MLNRRAIFAVCAASATALNLRPIIGILSMPNSEPFDPTMPGFFPASYVKWLEMSGARVVPLPFDQPEAVRALLPFINGALFTGGGVDFTFPNGTLTPFSVTASLIFNESVSAASSGEMWPLWGTCLGFQLISFLASDFDQSILTSGFDSENLTLPLSFTPAAAASKLYSPMPTGVIETFATLPVTMNNHHDGVTPTSFAGSSPLSSRFTVLSTNVDRKGAEFISSMEGQGNLPVYATQYHPEKIQFEWNPAEVINHAPESVLANLWPGLVFVNATRFNNRAFPSLAAESAALIYNYPAVYTAPTDPSFEQMYFM